MSWISWFIYLCLLVGDLSCGRTMLRPLLKRSKPEIRRFLCDTQGNHSTFRGVDMSRCSYISFLCFADKTLSSSKLFFMYFNILSFIWEVRLFVRIAKHVLAVTAGHWCLGVLLRSVLYVGFFVIL